MVLAINLWPVRLELTDQVILCVGLMVMLAWTMVWAARGGPKLLVAISPRPNCLTPEHVLVLVLAFLVVASLVQWLTKFLSNDVDYTLIGGNLAQMLGGVGCLVLAAKVFDGGAWRFVLGPKRAVPGLAMIVPLLLVALTASAIVLEATVTLIRTVSPEYQPAEHAVIEALHNQTLPVWPLWLGAVVIAPVAEECFFRGLLQTLFHQLPWPMDDPRRRIWLVVGLSSGLFGLAHMSQPHVVPAIIALGIILGLVYERTGSLIGPIALHALFNLKTLAWEVLAAADRT